VIRRLDVTDRHGGGMRLGGDRLARFSIRARVARPVRGLDATLSRPSLHLNQMISFREAAIMASEGYTFLHPFRAQD